MDEQIKSEIDAGLGSITDMFESCKVRGDQFKAVAIASFEASSIVEMYRFVCDAIGCEDHEELVNQFGLNIGHQIASIVAKISVGMNKPDIDEAIDFGIKVHERKVAMQARVQEIINKKV